MSSWKRISTSVIVLLKNNENIVYWKMVSDNQYHITEWNNRLMLDYMVTKIPIQKMSLSRQFNSSESSMASKDKMTHSYQFPSDVFPAFLDEWQFMLVFFLLFEDSYKRYWFHSLINFGRFKDGSLAVDNFKNTLTTLDLKSFMITLT